MDNIALAGYLKKQIQKYEGGCDLDSNKAVTINANGLTVINPTSGKDGMEKATVIVNVPVPTLESNKAVTVDVSNYSTPVEITPSSNKDAMEKITLTLNNIPSGGGGDIDTTKWKVYLGYIAQEQESSVTAVFLVSPEITDTGVYDVYAAIYNSDATGGSTLTHIANQTWTVSFDGCQNYEAVYEDTVSGNTYQIRWTSD